MTSSASALEDPQLTNEERNTMIQAYMKGLHVVFISFAVLIALHLCSCVSIRDYGLRQGKAQQRRGNDVDGSKP